MDKLTGRESLYSIVETLNTLIDKMNRLELLAKTLSNVEENYFKAFTAEELNKNLFTVEVTGIYKIRIEKGVAQVYINSAKNLTRVRYELTPEKMEINNLLLAAGDQLYFEVQNMDYNNNIYLSIEENLLKYLIKLDKKLDTAIETYEPLDLNKLSERQYQLLMEYIRSFI